MIDLEILRRTVARELDTINQYERDAAAAQDPRVRAFLEHLAWEEKEHVAEGMAVLRLFDARQDELASRGAHFLEGAPEAPPTSASAPAPPMNGGAAEPPAAVFKPGERFTVGGLRRKKRR